ncbi:esterase/lipase family protein [Rickettsia endosymbiont of Halotydeus destructor]|uniref:esterase/lipase family protein n=1 Tax=Rickettsia endosymbiont of Halotydeus destructor TaxID=2996754 RepID=UPI003BAE2DD5
MSSPNQPHLVILLHGISKSNSSLKGLEKFINSHGFSTLNINYPSTKYKIQELIELIHIKISSELNNYNIISFVGFSMGGLIIRAYLNQYKILNLGKVIMIGTPNNGSEVADFFKDNILYKKFFGPAGKQLVTGPKNSDNSDNLYGKLYYECGVIAGSLPLDFYYFLFKGKPNDGKVTVDSTKLEVMKDHIIVKISHWYLPRSKKVWNLIVGFLKYSTFIRKK